MVTRLPPIGLLIGGVLLILGVSLGFTNYLVDAEIPARAVEWTTRTIHSPFLFLLLLNLFLLVVGCLMEIYPAIVVEVGAASVAATRFAFWNPSNVSGAT